MRNINESTRTISYKEIKRQRMLDPNFKVRRATLEQPIAEMITTAQGLMDLVEKVRVDVEFGQADVPVLYEPIYRRIAPAGGFPGKAVDLGFNTLQANVVFLEKFEAGEIQFGTLSKGVPAVANLKTWAAGFEYTEDMSEWDETWSLELVNQAFGRSYNMLLNYLHLGPILTYTYTAPNSQAADATAGASLHERVLRTFQGAYRESVNAVPQRTFNTLLASETDRFLIEESLLQPVLDANGNQLAQVPIDTIIYYDGDTIDLGTNQVTYSGVTSGKVYGIFPNQKMLELVHHGLRVDADRPTDISRLIEAQIVGRTRRGVYADVANSVEEINIPLT